MNRVFCRACCLLAVILLAGMGVAQTEFSGEIVDNQKGDAPQAKIYSGKDKMRFESATADPKAGGAVIVNLATHTSTVLMPQRQMYMEMPPQMAGQRMNYTLFRVGDMDNACSEWLAQPRNKGGTCKKVGNETVNGRSTVKYEGTNANGDTGTVWIDPKLRFPVKWQGKNNSWELRNIQEGSQPASLFEVPEGYTKFDMGTMMQRQH